jgi:hypothetical protein
MIETHLWDHGGRAACLAIFVPYWLQRSTCDTDSLSLGNKVRTCFNSSLFGPDIDVQDMVVLPSASMKGFFDLSITSRCELLAVNVQCWNKNLQPDAAVASSFNIRLLYSCWTLMFRNTAVSAAFLLTAGVPPPMTLRYATLAFINILHY